MESEEVNISTEGTTPLPEVQKSIKEDVQSARGVVRAQNNHHQDQRRVFVGPMPERVALSVSGNQGVKLRGDNALGTRRTVQQGDDAMSTTSSSTGTMDDVDQEHALAFFVAEGGREEDFEGHERGVRKEIRRRLNESRWMPLLSKSESEAQHATSNQRWIGDTFEIGKDLLGLPTVNVESMDTATIEGSPVPSTMRPELVGRAGGSKQTGVLTTTTATGVTGRHISFATAPQGGNEESHGPAQERAASFTGPALTTSTAAGTPMQPSSGHQPPQDVGSTTSFPPTPINSSKTNLIPLPTSERSRPMTIKAQSERDALHTGVPPPKKQRSTSLSSLRHTFSKDSKGKGRPDSFHSGPPIHPSSYSSPAQEPPPAPPAEVLTRDATEEPSTSAGAAVLLQQDLQPPTQDTDIVMRDRMLVRVLYCKQESFTRYMDETHLAEITDVKQEEWGEFIVVWRRGRIELYEDYTIGAQEWFLKHKHLAFVIPLRPGSTKITIFSRTDMSICLECPPTPACESRSRKWFYSRETGTNLFLLRTKSRSRAVDWLWKLWRQLGGEIPDSITIRCPALEARVEFPIPVVDFATGSEGWHTFTRDKVIENCRKQMNGIHDWDTLVEEPIRKGERLELCWRSGSKLDWVWLERDEEGRDRPWAVLWGVASVHPRVQSDLELRIADHSHTKFVLRNGSTLREPPALEGYLYRYRRGTHLRDATYVATHDGNVFFVPTVSSHPPAPPTLPINPTNPIPLPDPRQHTDITTSTSTHSASSAPTPALTHAGEVARGAAQILAAKSFLDMRDIVEVRRAKEPWHPVMPGTNLFGGKKRKKVASQSQNQRTGAQSQASRSMPSTTHLLGTDDGGGPLADIGDIQLDEEDRADPGGDEVLNRIADQGGRNALKTRRSFELVLRSGEIVRFEAYSCKVAAEWTVGLGSLISYWTRKHRVDAREEMDIVHAISGRTRYMAPKIGDHAYPAPPPDPREVSPLLGGLWHWCALENCRSIVRAGRLFMREGLRGEMKHFYFVLISGHLVRFKLNASSFGLHGRSHAIHLLDTYVTSGHFAALGLPPEDLDDSRAARRYQDGLETGDNDRDTLIVLRYRERAMEEPQCFDVNAAVGLDGRSIDDISISRGVRDVPSLNGQRKMLVLRARSKLERDEWCWALNVEMERLVRLHRVREAAVRQQGNVLPQSS